MAKITLQSSNFVYDTDAAKLVGITPQAGIPDVSYFPTMITQPPVSAEPALATYSGNLLTGFLNKDGSPASIGGGSSPITLTTSRPLALTDNGNTLVYAGAVDIQLTYPTGLGANFSCTVIQVGTGKVSVVAGSGVTQANIGLTQGANTFMTIQSTSANVFAVQNPAGTSAQLIGVATIPFIALATGSWTMAANGAMTLGAAQPLAWPVAYIYMPANSITATNPAGWYYAVFSSTTAVTLYNNTYNVTTGGQPTIPSSPTAFVATAGTNTTQDSMPLQGPTYTLPGGTLGKNGYVQASLQVQTSNSAQTKKVSIGYGSATPFDFAQLTTSPNLGEIDVIFQNMSTANRQMVRTKTSSATSGSPVITTQDTTANIAIAVLLNAGTTANDYATCHYARMNYQYGA